MRSRACISFKGCKAGMETTREELIWEEAEAGVTLSGGKPDKRLEETSENS